ncbi:unnamed protein product, partial [Allacma fusca]
MTFLSLMQAYPSSNETCRQTSVMCNTRNKSHLFVLLYKLILKDVEVI